MTNKPGPRLFFTMAVLSALMPLLVIFTCSCAGAGPGGTGSAPENGSGIPGNILSHLEKTVGNDVYLEDANVGGLAESELREKIKSLAAKIDTGARDARLDPETWEVAFAERQGVKVNVEKTAALVLGASSGDRLETVKDISKPAVTSRMLRDNIVEISSFSTPLLDRENSRINNISIAAGYIGGDIVDPGEEFSFNGTVGRRTKGKGYRDAAIIVKTEDGVKKGRGTGGGVCQVSSTLYNAVLSAGLKVTERHGHSKNVGYVPPGKDATVSFGSVDFKFVNTRSHPVMITASVSGGEFTVTLLENRN